MIPDQQLVTKSTIQPPGMEGNSWQLLVIGICHVLVLLRAKRNREKENSKSFDAPIFEGNRKFSAPSKEIADSLGEGEVTQCDVKIIKRNIINLSSHFKSDG